ncbi:Rossmann-fold NAD(P)-binding domain-containing protein [Nonomuraea africana]|uniref:hypothetical protein n=1 Tax=Nonomuraea africana TaxID=46171 RepID=UPI0033EC0E2C
MNCANNFNQNFDEDLWLEPLRAGRLALPIGETPEPFIDVEDVADVAAEVLARGGHSGQVYDLSGPRGLSFRAAVEIIAGAAGRGIDYVELTPEVYRAELAASGYPEAAVAALDAMFAMHREGHTVGSGRRGQPGARARAAALRGGRKAGGRLGRVVGHILTAAVGSPARRLMACDRIAARRLACSGAGPDGTRLAAAPKIASGRKRLRTFPACRKPSARRRSAPPMAMPPLRHSP